MINSSISQEPAQAREGEANGGCGDGSGLSNYSVSTRRHAIRSLDLPVVVAPGKALRDELLGPKRLHQFDDLQVRHAGYFRVLGQIVVLFGIQDTLCTRRAIMRRRQKRNERSHRRGRDDSIEAR